MKLLSRTGALSVSPAGGLWQGLGAVCERGGARRGCPVWGPGALGFGLSFSRTLRVKWAPGWAGPGGPGAGRPAALYTDDRHLTPRGPEAGVGWRPGGPGRERSRSPRRWLPEEAARRGAPKPHAHPVGRRASVPHGDVSVWLGLEGRGE